MSSGHAPWVASSASCTTSSAAPRSPVREYASPTSRGACVTREVVELVHGGRSLVDAPQSPIDPPRLGPPRFVAESGGSDPENRREVENETPGTFDTKRLRFVMRMPQTVRTPIHQECHVPTAAAIQEKAYQRRWAILVVLCVSLLVIVLDNSILNVAIPTLIRDLDASNSQVQWMVDSYTLVFAGLLLTMGALGDRYGRRGALQAGYVLFGLGSLASAFAGLGRPADRHPCVHGHRRRADHAGDAVDHHQRLPAARARPRHRRVGRDRGHRHRARPAHRWLPARRTSTGARSSS